MLAAVLLISAIAVISARNTVHSVLFLILAFVNGAGLMILLGADYLAMMMLIVYVGAVAVLFLFVVMMLNVSVTRIRSDWLKYGPFGLLIAGIMVTELTIVFWSAGQTARPGKSFIAHPEPEELSQIEAIGRLLYTDYFYLFQISGLILLVAMIGAITLTLRRREGVRRQDVNAQRERKRSDVIEITQPKSGEGVNV